MNQNQTEIKKLKALVKRLTTQRDNLRKWMYISLINDGSYRVKKTWFKKIPDHVEDWFSVEEHGDYYHMLLVDHQEEDKLRRNPDAP